jgi:hypothetical protein
MMPYLPHQLSQRREAAPGGSATRCGGFWLKSLRRRSQKARLSEGKPETFDFLGFTHFCTRSRKWGSFGRKTIKKRMRAKLKAIKVELRKSMARPHREDRSLGEADAARASELLRGLG